MPRPYQSHGRARNPGVEKIMNESIDTRILLFDDADAILAFESGQMAKTMSDPMEREMASWNARYRKEALEHYLPKGWSFGSFRNGQLVGYILGQPLVFLRGHTQTLWIEYLSASYPGVAKTLMEVAHKWARDKHLQCLLMELNAQTEFVLTQWPQSHKVDGGLIELKSARY
jgi:hypothetical protein